MSRGRALRQLAAIFAGDVPANADWTAILELANEQLITPELYDHLHRSGKVGELPADLKAFLEDVARRSQERSSRLANTMDDALGALNAIGVSPVLLKGCSAWVGPAPTRSRIVSDIDLLVRPAETTAAIESLSRLGFSIVEDHRNEQFHRAVVLARPEDVGSIDLHEHSPGPATWSSAIDAHEHSRPVSFRARTALLPSTEVQILIAVLHDQFQDGRFWRGGFDLRHLLDIATFAASADGVDWERLRDLCKTPSIRQATLSQLWAAKRIVGARIPDRAIEGLWGRLHYRRQRAQYVWPILNAPFHRLGLNKDAWMRLSSRMTKRAKGA